MRRPLAADLLLAGLLLVGLAALGVVSERWPFVGACGVAVVVAAVWPGRRYALDRGMHVAYVALPYVVLARAWPVKVRGIDLSLAFYQGLFLSTVGAMVLAGRRGPVRAARVLFVSGVSLSAAGTDIDHATYLPLVAAWAALALFAPLLERTVAPGPDPARRPRGPRRASLALGAAAALATVGSVRALEASYEDLNRAFYRMVGRAQLTSPGGFSGRAELGSVADMQGRQGDSVALRAFGPRAPGYLRARVFLTYEQGKWGTTDAEHPNPQRREVPDGRYVLDGKREVVGAPEWRIHPGARYGLHVFLPLEAAVLAGAPPAFDVWPGETLVWREGGSSRGYAVHADPAPIDWRPDADAPAWRHVPEDAALVDALDETLARCGLTGPVEGAQAVRRAVQALGAHFASRYQYHVGIDFDRGRDPVEQFLREKDRGHCELFAAAGTLLLRRLGVAARYTTGFVCAEKNAWSEQWIARNKHAHAWLEVLDPERGWQTVELTPSSGVPAPQPPGGMEAFLDAVAGVWEQLEGAARSLDVQGLFVLLLAGLAGAVNWVLGAWWRLALLCLAIAGLALRAWLRRRARGVTPARRLPPDLERDRARLRALERALARLDLARAAAETLLEWADRLEAAPQDVPERAASVAFVRGYAGRRYAATAAGADP